MLTLVGFTSVFSIDDLINTLLSQGYILEDNSHYGNNGHNIYSRTGEQGRETLTVQVQLVDQPESCPLMTSFNRKVAVISNVQREERVWRLTGILRIQDKGQVKSSFLNIKLIFLTIRHIFKRYV